MGPRDTILEVMQRIDKLEVEKSISPQEAGELNKLFQWLKENISKFEIDGIEFGFPQIVSVRLRRKRNDQCLKVSPPPSGKT